MEKVTFKPNVPQQVALKYAQGRMISGRWGEQMLYTLTDERQMYVSMEVAAKINLLVELRALVPTSRSRHSRCNSRP